MVSEEVYEQIQEGDVIEIDTCQGAEAGKYPVSKVIKNRKTTELHVSTTEGIVWYAGRDSVVAAPAAALRLMRDEVVTSTFAPLEALPTGDNNPKAKFGDMKTPLHLVPPSSTYHLAGVLKHGADKYGPFNWREEAISMSTYVGAIRRHLDAWWDGQDNAFDSGQHHIAHVMASCALILDAMECGMLVDDRPPKGSFARLVGEDTVG